MPDSDDMSREVDLSTPSVVPDSAPRTPGPRAPILDKDEASRRAALLCDLQGALEAQGVSSVLARNHRLVLEGAGTKAAPSGLTDPQLYVFTSGGTGIVTTNGRNYLLGRSRAYPVDDLAAAAHGAAAAACRNVPGTSGTRGRVPAGWIV